MELRLRQPDPTEKVGSYFPFFAWPVIWVLPYGWWTWAIAFSPEALLWLFRKAWASRSPRFVTPRSTASGIELVESGAVVESFAHADVETLTTVIAKDGAVDAVRIDRKQGRPIVLAALGPADAASIAERLGLDLAVARSRYRVGSLALRFMAFALLGWAACAWLVWGSPSENVALVLRDCARWVWMPLLVLTSIPTVLDVGRDGVAWRWLFVKRYVAYSSVAAIERVPSNAHDSKVNAFRLHTADGKMTTRIFLGRSANGAVARMQNAWDAAREAKADPIDEWVLRRDGESVRAWTDRLRARARSAGAYRGVTIDHLWAFAADPAVDKVARLGALLVLGAREGAVEKTRAIAGQVVDPAWRDAVEAIARGASDDEVASSVERALDAK
jgi:hypothetical protein